MAKLLNLVILLGIISTAAASINVWVQDSPNATIALKKPTAGAASMPLRRCEKNGYYFAEFLELSYFQAMAFCRQHGMHLVSVESAAEQECLVRNIYELGLQAKNFWTSANDLSETKAFVWMSTGNSLRRQNYTAWQTRQPDTFCLKTECEHCMVLWSVKISSRTHLWNDLPCSNKEAFICEIELEDC